MLMLSVKIKRAIKYNNLAHLRNKKKVLFNIFMIFILTLMIATPF